MSVLTGITTNGVDLGNLFQPLTSTTTVPMTGYYASNGKDLSKLFEPYSSGGTKVPTTGYTVVKDGDFVDLSDVFAKMPDFAINVSNPYNLSYSSVVINGYTVYSFNVITQNTGTNVSSGTATITFSRNSTISVLLAGGGGGGGAGKDAFSAGGGAGGNFSDVSTANVIAGNTYTVQVGIGGSLYTDDITIKNGGESSLKGVNVALVASGGTAGLSSTASSYGSPGTSINGGNGGKASGVFDFDPKTGALVCVGKPGINGVYSSFTTDYGEILNIGGGGGGGAVNSYGLSPDGAGYGGNNGIGGAGGTSDKYTNATQGTGYGAGGGGGSALLNSDSTSGGGCGTAGVVIIYFKNP